MPENTGDFDALRKQLVISEKKELQVSAVIEG